MLIEYIYEMMFFVMPIVGMFVAVVVAGIKNMRSEAYAVERNNYIEYSNYLNKGRYDKREWRHVDNNRYEEKKECYIDKEEAVVPGKLGIIINMNDWTKKKVMNKLSDLMNSKITSQVAMNGCVGESLTYIDYGLASAILTAKKKEELANWLKQNQKKDVNEDLVDNYKKHKGYISKFKKFSFIKKYKFRRQRIRAGP